MSLRLFIWVIYSLNTKLIKEHENCGTKNYNIFKSHSLVTLHHFVQSSISLNPFWW